MQRHFLKAYIRYFHYNVSGNYSVKYVKIIFQKDNIIKIILYYNLQKICTDNHDVKFNRTERKISRDKIDVNTILWSITKNITHFWVVIMFIT